MKLKHFIARHPVVVLDGALATELERRGADLQHRLWSARMLLEDPDEISAVHRDYLAAGAQILITASYQATHPGYVAAGYPASAADDAIRCSVALAHAARERWSAQQPGGSEQALIAGSVGPYGAYTADGGEYRGRYGLSIDALAAFHRPRIALLVAAGVDCIACETIPDLDEVIALCAVLRDFPETDAWVSLSCRDGAHTCAGQPIQDVATFLETQPHISAIGVNCTAPQHITPLVEQMRLHTTKPIIVYPNSGEHYDPVTKTWSGTTTCADYLAAARTWVAAGASLIGGCCRTTPAHIATLVHAFQPERQFDAS
jgi:homocysteine S-methyltransferase